MIIALEAVIMLHGDCSIIPRMLAMLVRLRTTLMDDNINFVHNSLFTFCWSYRKVPMPRSRSSPTKDVFTRTPPHSLTSLYMRPLAMTEVRRIWQPSIYVCLHSCTRPRSPLKAVRDMVYLIILAFVSSRL